MPKFNVTSPYPPQHGFLLDVNGNGYLVAASAPFSQRSLPPESLKADPRNPEFPNSYHLYKVIRPFTVISGPIAPWFGQPGFGSQFWTGTVGNIAKLISDGYVERQDLPVLAT
ncbi:hypothetical protein ISF_07879 [Cordyceps fumosorosea ARSEF 2679]|uniref:TNT domain-containing protein n=1 Tax=Cordyceps fumosorosea (strain ARSEF 2679) TaxID=1081104 RepID=A0A167NBR9_CORFA|nr:hypothetical protein ISF_07879 [Cordyceps fumosorosea ARSEF 2679]OAA55368.1 hypothetical protein ISF_07879 [Cordyceps fumosorosea ARSEF 2679]